MVRSSYRQGIVAPKTRCGQSDSMMISFLAGDIEGGAGMVYHMFSSNFLTRTHSVIDQAWEPQPRGAWG